MIINFVYVVFGTYFKFYQFFFARPVEMRYFPCNFFFFFPHFFDIFVIFVILDKYASAIESLFFDEKWDKKFVQLPISLIGNFEIISDHL